MTPRARIAASGDSSRTTGEVCRAEWQLNVLRLLSPSRRPVLSASQKATDFENTHNKLTTQVEHKTSVNT